ncbi:SMI1/KNR4 family protein [Streptomyces sp. SID3212]|uniref:SMI1/KNR4 family protein n=1 Tax=unclassified Streptomyces TaxID=2593676 RepID=UPI001370454E|nr:SMI1/KNR4 family protein [Streptomyces sp. SID3212]
MSGRQSDQEQLQTRQVVEAWGRIEAWLAEHAPASFASLKAGASEEEITALEDAVGVHVPAGVKALWRMHAGADAVASAVFMLGNWALTGLDSVEAVYRRRMLFQVENEAEGYMTWKAPWIPLCSYTVTDTSYGLCVDGKDGTMWEWEETAQVTPRFDSLTDYLEEMADALESPALALGPMPGVAHGALMWGEPSDPAVKEAWVPLA